LFIVNVEGAIYKDDKWLVVERSTKEEHAGGTISLVGGKVDNEGNVIGILEQTIKREIFEEIGVQIKDNVHYVYNSSFVSDKGSAVINVVFLCEYLSGEAHPKSPDEIENVYWLTYDEVMNHPKTPPWTKESIKRSEQIRKNLIK
jgi:NADH pyrophosphatase NudC (nudix superfamily)